VDGENRRIGKKVNGALVQGFLYENQLEPVAELYGDGSLKARFVYSSKQHVPDYMIKDGDTYQIISDHLGSPRLVIDTSTNTITQRMDYDEFGNVILDTTPASSPLGLLAGCMINILFTSEHYYVVSNRSQLLRKERSELEQP
jgi:YD repeat-containing protein